MARFEVTTGLIVHLNVAVEIEAESSSLALDAAAEMLPNNFNDRARGWKADVVLKPPKGMKVRVLKAIHFEQTSGGEKAKRVG